MTIPFNPSWPGMEPGQLPTRAIKACLAWLDRAIPSFRGGLQATYQAKREALKAKLTRSEQQSRKSKRAANARSWTPPSTVSDLAGCAFADAKCWWHLQPVEPVGIPLEWPSTVDPSRKERISR